MSLLAMALAASISDPFRCIPDGPGAQTGRTSQGLACSWDYPHLIHTCRGAEFECDRATPVAVCTKRGPRCDANTTVCAPADARQVCYATRSHGHMQKFWNIRAVCDTDITSDVCNANEKKFGPFDDEPECAWSLGRAKISPFISAVCVPVWKWVP